MKSQEKLKNRATAIILKEDKILLFHRFKQGKEYWVFPGGSIEKGETPGLAVNREIKEELNLEVKDKRFLFKIQNQGREEYHYLIKEYIGEPKLGAEFEIFNKEDYAVISWVPIEEIKNLENLYPVEGKSILTKMYCITI